MSRFAAVPLNRPQAVMDDAYRRITRRPGSTVEGARRADADLLC